MREHERHVTVQYVLLYLHRTSDAPGIKGMRRAKGLLSGCGASSQSSEGRVVPNTDLSCWHIVVIFLPFFGVLRALL